MKCLNEMTIWGQSQSHGKAFLLLQVDSGCLAGYNNNITALTPTRLHAVTGVRQTDCGRLTMGCDKFTANPNFPVKMKLNKLDSSITCLQLAILKVNIYNFCKCQYDK